MNISSSSSFESLILSNKKAIGEDLSNKEFTNCQFENCDFSQGDFSYTDFTDCTFKNCNLSLAKFTDSKLRGVAFSGCKLVGINFGKCDSFIVQVDFEDSLIQTCSFSNLNLRKRIFRSCRIVESDFVDNDLSEANFSRSCLAGTSFHNCNLHSADFSHAQDYQIDPFHNNIKKAIFMLPDAVSMLNYFDIILK